MSRSTHSPLRRRTFLQAALAAPVLLTRVTAQSPTAASSKPRLTLNVRELGATGDGTTKDTAALQKALDRCSVLGGGEVLVPAGNYLTGALALRSNTILRLARDAVIQGTPDFGDYPVTQVRWEGKWIEGHVGLIYAIGAEHI